MKFCNNCKSILNTKFTASEQIITCSRCDKKYNVLPEDTLISNMSFDDTSSVDKYELFLKNIENDRVNLSKKIDCPNNSCSSKIATYVILGDSCTFVYKCVICSTIWQ